MAAGDFDHDGFADVAIRADSGFIGGVGHAGSVNVLYGSPSGLAAAGNQLWTQDSPGVVGSVAEKDDRFGGSLCTVDFENNGYNDLAVGVQDESIGSVSGAGAVTPTCVTCQDFCPVGPVRVGDPCSCPDLLTGNIQS